MVTLRCSCVQVAGKKPKKAAKRKSTGKAHKATRGKKGAAKKGGKGSTCFQKCMSRSMKGVRGTDHNKLMSNAAHHCSRDCKK